MKKSSTCPSHRLLNRCLAVAFTCLAASLLMLKTASADSIAVGDQHNVVRGSDGTLWTWGGNSNGQLGLGNSDSQPIPERVLTPFSFESVAAGHAHTLGIAEDGRLFAWGRNSEGQLGLGDRETQLEPVQVGSDADWEAVAAGAYHTVGIRGGALYAWGSNSAGQVGNGSFSAVLEPVEVGNGESWLAVAAGEFHSLAVRADGTLWAWGSNGERQLGLSSTSNVPLQVGNDTDWKVVAAGAWHSLALKTDGSLWAWGRNMEGQLGVGVGATGSTPARVGTHSDWVAIAAGRNHSVGLRAEGAGQNLWAWGANANGQLGDGSYAQRWRPVPVGSRTDWVGVAAGRNHTVGLTSDFLLFSTGSNEKGQLGIGDPDVGDVNRMQTVVFRKPDLEVISVGWDSTDPLGVYADPFEITLEWGNRGSAFVPETASFDIQLLLVGEGGIDEAIVLLEETVSRRIEVGELITQDFSLVPSGGIPAGEYELAVILDPEGKLDETVVENNIGWTDTSRLFLPDLRVAGVDLTAISVSPGEETEFAVTVENFGIADLSEASFDVQLSLRPQAGDDYLLPTVWESVEYLGAGDSVQLVLPTTLPIYLPPGDYRLFVELNGSETVEEIGRASCREGVEIGEAVAEA